MTSQDKDIANELTLKFNEYLTAVSNFLERKPIVQPTEIHLKEDQLIFEEKNTSFDIGVKRYYDKDNLILIINQESLEILEFILLREAYYCFIPELLQNHSLIKLCIILKVSEFLKEEPNFEIWERKLKIDPFYTEYFLRFNIVAKIIKQIFDFIYKYTFLGLSIEEQLDIFDSLIYDYIFQRGFLDSNEKIEFLQIFYSIFRTKKKFTNIIDYSEDFLKIFREGQNKYIPSIKRFKELFNELIEEKVITSTYQVNWKYFNCSYYKCFLSFNPLIDNYTVNLTLKNLTFCFVIDLTEHNLAIECELFFVIPYKYIEDMKNYFARIKNFGILKEYFILEFESYENTLNLNHFQEGISKQESLFIKNKNLNKDLILSPNIQYIHKKESNTNIIDLLLIDRIRWITSSGFGVEHQKDRFKKIKNDLFSYLLNQKNNITKLKSTLDIFYDNLELKHRFLKFINLNKSYGFFSVKKQVKDLCQFIQLLKQKSISDLTNSLEEITKYGISSDLNINIKYKNFKHKLILSDGLKSSKIFSKIESDMTLFSKLIDAFENIKIYNLNFIEKILTEWEYARRLCSTKIDRIKKVRKRFRKQKIKMRYIENKFQNIIESDPPGAVPFMVNSITVLNIASNVYHIFLKDSDSMEEKLTKLKNLIPRTEVMRGKNALSEEKYLWIRLFIIDLDHNAKRKLVSMINNMFQEDLIFFRNIISTPFLNYFSLKDFYDPNNNDFFYSEDLFEELYKFSISLIKDKLSLKKYKLKTKTKLDFKLINKMFKEKISPDEFAEQTKVNKKFSLKKIPLNEIAVINNSLERFFLGNEDYEGFKKISPFIKKIDFIPMYQKFGLENYYLYFQPEDMNNNEWKMMFPLGFKKLEYRAILSRSNSFLFNYVFPYNNPNFSYFNWLVKSKNAINKYIWFSVKKVIPILNFDYNIEFDSFFQTFYVLRKLTQKVLFSRDLDFSFESRSFLLSDNTVGIYKGPKDNDFKDLVDLTYMDIKNIITKKHERNLQVKNLIEKELIFPFLTLKNEVGFTNKFYAIIPDLSEIQMDKIIKIFSFLNYGFIFRISGKYFFKELGEEITFERGVFLKFYFPNSNLSQFKQIVCDLLDYFKITHYFLSFDLIEGDRFRDELFPKWSHPNPLNCHIWNEKEGLWINHKSIVSNFEAIYPEDQKKYTETNMITNI